MYTSSFDDAGKPVVLFNATLAVVFTVTQIPSKVSKEWGKTCVYAAERIFMLLSVSVKGHIMDEYVNQSTFISAVLHHI